jgi:hypothetical protein
MNIPHSYNVSGCCHPDIQDKDPGMCHVNLDQKNIIKTWPTFYLPAPRLNMWHLKVGLCKQTLFSSLPRHPLPVLNILMMDIMNLTVLNDLNLFMKLFIHKMNVYEPDDQSTWDWAIFYKNNAVWKAQSEFVFILLSGEPQDLPKNYKAWEFQQYIYGLGPALF